MDDRLNKPRVFLSHCKTDKSFIDKVADDLRKCQIDTWLDEVDIRHGKPWLDSIFQGGIPTCDSVLVYLTEDSIKSSMVKKEIDASIIQQLADNKIGFLPYVKEEELRASLRSDLQTLQTPVWNDENYGVLLPQIVAEIWRSFLERTVGSAVQSEENRRLKAELELEKMKQVTDTGVFSESENKEFEFIWGSLDRWESISYVVAEGTDAGERPVCQLMFNVGSVLPVVAKAGEVEFNNYLVQEAVREAIERDYARLGLSSIEASKIVVTKWPKIGNELLMFGCIQNAWRPDQVRSGMFASQMGGDYLEMTGKIYRLKFWLEYNGKLPESVRLELPEDVPE